MRLMKEISLPHYKGIGVGESGERADLSVS